MNCRNIAADSSQAALSENLTAMSAATWQAWPERNEIRFQGDIDALLKRTSSEELTDFAEAISYVHEDYREQFSAALMDVYRNAVPTEFDYCIREARTGPAHWFRMSARPLLDANGATIGVQGIVFDAHHRILAEQELAELRERQDRSLKAAGVGSWIWHVDAGHVEIDTHIEEVFGIPSGSFDGTPEGWHRIIHPDDADTALDAMTGCVHSGEEFEVRYRVPQPDGSLKWFVTRGEPTRHDADGNVIIVSGASWDVHDEMQALEQAEIALMRVQQATEISGTGFWQLDPASGVVEFNQDWRHRAGIADSEKLNLRYILTHIADEDADRFKQDLQTTLKAGQSINTEFGWHRPDNGEYMRIRVRGNAVYNDQGEVVRLSGVNIDDTDIYRARVAFDRQQQRYTSAMQAMGVGTWLYHCTENRVEIDATYARLSGIDASQFDGHLNSFMALPHPEDRAACDAALAEVMQTGRHSGITFRRILPGGEIRWLRARAEVLEFENGKPSLVAGVNWDITDEVKSREVTDALAARVDAATQVDAIAFWELDTANHVIDFNIEWRRKFGMPETGMIPMNALLGNIHPDDLAEYQSDVSKAATTGAPLRSRFRYYYHQGSPRAGEIAHIRAFGSVQRNSAGEIISLSGVALDETEAALARQQMQSALEKVDTAAQAGRLGLWQLQAHTREIEFDHNWRRMLGYSPGAPSPSLPEAMALVHPEDLQNFSQAIETALEQGQPLSHEFRACRVDDAAQIHLRIQGDTVQDSAGRFTGLAGFVLDQTTMVESRRELALLRQRHDRALITGEVASWYWVAEEDSLQYDTWLPTLFGLEEGELGHRIGDFFDAVYPPDREHVENIMATHIEAGDRIDTEYRVQGRFAEPHWIRAHGSIERDENGKAVEFNGLIHDVTEEVHLRESLKRSNRDLDDFAYIASHDLREPLRGIHNFLGFMRSDYGNVLDDTGREMMDTMTELAERLDSLLEELLNFSRVGRTELAVVSTDLNTVLNDILSTLDFSLKEKNVDVRIPQSLPTIECDRVRTGELFRNLITNAAKYNDKDEKWIEIGCDNGVFHVRDNGIGIAEHNRERVFKIFKRLHTRGAYGGGTGAGLTIAQQIAERHGGRLWLESEKGVGTTFYFTLSSMG